MLDMTTLRRLHDQLNRDAITKGIALYALFENMEGLEAQYSASARIIGRFKMGRIGYREVVVSVQWLEPRSFLIFDHPQDALKKMGRQEVAA